MPSALSVTGPPAVPGPNDCVYGVATEGIDRGHLKALLCSVKGCETTGIYLNARRHVDVRRHPAPR